jgi:hypothetical protein
VDGCDEVVRIARHHRKAPAILGALPERGDREHALVGAEPHFALQRRLAVAKIVLVR